ncbi:DUF1090 domain-containing protein [Arthrobacter sp. NPDC080086]|uniref:DUF1090 domain-containing protein n=1 Tax=Arthrobacter sp. NPDC080086 TaxID=3155917 RepID=UPI00344C8A00
MNKTLLAAIVPFALTVASPAFADNVDCGTKIRAIETQIGDAQKYGNTNRIAGLQDALANTKAHCTNTGLADRADRKVSDARRDVEKAQVDVREAEDKLRAARNDGKDKKIRKAERNLADKQRKLREKTADLRSAEADRAAVKG